MPFPPGKERLDIPTELVNEGNLLGGQFKAVRGNPVEFACYFVTDQTQRFFGLINALLPQENLGVIENGTVG